VKVPRQKGKTKFVFHYNWQKDVEVTVKKLCKPAIVYKIALSENLETSGLQNCNGGKCYRVLARKTLSRVFVLSQSTFHLVFSLLQKLLL